MLSAPQLEGEQLKVMDDELDAIRLANAANVGLAADKLEEEAAVAHAATEGAPGFSTSARLRLEKPSAPNSFASESFALRCRRCNKGRTKLAQRTEDAPTTTINWGPLQRATCCRELAHGCLDS